MFVVKNLYTLYDKFLYSMKFFTYEYLATHAQVKVQKMVMHTV